MLQYQKILIKGVGANEKCTLINVNKDRQTKSEEAGQHEDLKCVTAKTASIGDSVNDTFITRRCHETLMIKCVKLSL
jgi:hypothetical protein